MALSTVSRAAAQARPAWESRQSNGASIAVALASASAANLLSAQEGDTEAKHVE